MAEPDTDLADDLARLDAVSDRIAGQLASLAAERILELMEEFAPDEPLFIRAVRVPRPGQYGDPPPIIVEDEIAAMMQERPSLVGVMVGRYVYDVSDRGEERQKAAHTAVELGLLIARKKWDEKFGPSPAPCP